MAHNREEGRRRLAAVDVGSNTVHALVADGWDAKLEDVAHYVEMPELGVAVQKSGRIGPRPEPVLVLALSEPGTAAKVEGINYFADTLLFAGTILALASASPRSDWDAGEPTLSAATATTLSQRSVPKM